MNVTPLGKHLGARIEGIDLARLDEAGFRALEAAFHRHAVIAVSDQHLDERAFLAFSRRFGPLESGAAGGLSHPQYPEIGVLSNETGPDGRIIGAPDGGQGWHAHASYRPTPARASILYALEVPQREGEPLGDMLFAATAAAYESLEPALKDRLEELHAVHDFEKFDEEKTGNTGAAQAAKPPVTHRMAVRHPYTGQRCLYVDPGATTRIVGLEPAESLGLLDYLFAFQTQPAFLYRHKWRGGDVLIWDNVATIHRTSNGDPSHEHRVMWRTHVLGDPERYRDAQDV